MSECYIYSRWDRCILSPLVFRGWSARFSIWYYMCNQMLAGDLFVVDMLAYSVRPNVSEGLGGLEVSLYLGFSRNAYSNRLSPAPSSHCRWCALILCAGNLDPLVHLCVARTKVMAILILTYLNTINLWYIMLGYQFLFQIFYLKTSKQKTDWLLWI